MDGDAGAHGPSRRRFLAAATAGLAVGVAGCIETLDPDPDLIGTGPSIRLAPVADGFTYPTNLAQPPAGDDRLFVTDQPGTVYAVDPDDGTVTTYLDLTAEVIDIQGGFSEQGLLGIAFHPDFADNGRFFVRYSSPERGDRPGQVATEVLEEYRADGETADASSRRRLLSIPQPGVIHNSGEVLFGPDGYLYLTTGDGGGTFDDQDPGWYEFNPGATGQTTTDNLLGGVLRIDVDDTGEDPYAIPPDNPLVDAEGHRGEYYAWGFRNPWGASFDGDDLYVANVGQALVESAYLVERGGNHGWNVREGTHCYDADDSLNPPAECPSETPATVRGGEPIRDPIIEYPHYAVSRDDDGGVSLGDERVGSAIVGGYVYRGDELDALQGGYVCCDWSASPHGAPDGRVFLARPPEAVDDVHWYYAERDLWPVHRCEVHSEDDVTVEGRLARYASGMGRDRDGALYVLVTGTNEVTGDTGEVRRIAP